MTPFAPDLQDDIELHEDRSTMKTKKIKIKNKPSFDFSQ